MYLSGIDINYVLSLKMKYYHAGMATISFSVSQKRPRRHAIALFLGIAFIHVLPIQTLKQHHAISLLS